jgi:hypothetical protein
LFNRPGLTAIAYRSGTWHEFVVARFALAGTAHPELAGLATRADDDFIALLDAVPPSATSRSIRSASRTSRIAHGDRAWSVLEQVAAGRLRACVAAARCSSLRSTTRSARPGVATVDIGVKVQSILATRRNL